MRKPTKAWVVFADDQGPIEGYELPNLVDWNGTIRREPIFFDVANTYTFMPMEPNEFDLHLHNEGPFVRHFPREGDDQSWTPATPKEIEA